MSAAIAAPAFLLCSEVATQVRAYGTTLTHGQVGMDAHAPPALLAQAIDASTSLQNSEVSRPELDEHSGQSNGAPPADPSHHATLEGHPDEFLCQLPMPDEEVENLPDAWELADLVDFFGPDAHLL